MLEEYSTVLVSEDCNAEREFLTLIDSGQDVVTCDIVNPSVRVMSNLMTLRQNEDF